MKRERDSAPKMLAMNIFPSLLSMAQQPNSDKGSLTFVVYRSRTIRQAQPGGLLWTSDQLVTVNAIYTTHKKHEILTSLCSAGFEHATQGIKRLQTYILDRTTTGIS